MEQVCLSVTQANNGYLPDRPTFGIGQPTTLDPSRAPEGGWILWIQMQELPRHLKGDAAGEIAIPEDGRWNDAVREAVADRIQQRLEMVMPGVSDLIVGRKAISPLILNVITAIWWVGSLLRNLFARSILLVATVCRFRADQSASNGS